MVESAQVLNGIQSGGLTLALDSNALNIAQYRSLVQQVVPRQFLSQVKDGLNSPGTQAARKAIGAYPMRLDLAKLNLAAAYRAQFPTSSRIAPCSGAGPGGPAPSLGVRSRGGRGSIWGLGSVW